jgi:Domain of unknown function (DUF4159)
MQKRSVGAPVRLPRRQQLTVLLVAVLLAASVSGAQFRGGGRLNEGIRRATPQSFDGAFNFCRIQFRQSRSGDGNGWRVDYPRADENLSIRLSELTKTAISQDDTGEPNHFVLALTDPLLFHCPFTMLTEPGGAYFDEAEAAPLREYLLKGGFLWVDDFWGPVAWDNWAAQIAKALPPGEFPIEDLPLDHPIFHTVLNVKRVPQIPSIGAWAGSGGGTSERGAASAVPHVRAIRDGRGRVMVLMTFNTDFGDSFEEEATDHEYFLRFSVEGYAFGINALVYAMTH